MTSVLSNLPPTGRDPRRAWSRPRRNRVAGFGIGIGHDGDIGGLLEREQPAIQALLAGAGARLFDDHRIDAGKFCRIRDVARPGIHGIEHVLLELRAEQCELLHHDLVTFLAVTRQAHAGQPEILERAFQHATLRTVELAGCSLVAMAL